METNEELASNNSDELIAYSLGLVGKLIGDLMVSETKSSPSIDPLGYLSIHSKVSLVGAKLEEALMRIRKNQVSSSQVDTSLRLPNLKLTTAIDSLDEMEHMPASTSRTMPNMTAPRRDHRNNAHSISSFAHSELVSSSVISSTTTSSTTADLSEDEQINYYPEEFETENSKRSPDSTQRRFSDSSDRTLVVMPTPSKSTLVETVILNKLSQENNLDADDEGELRKRSDEQLIYEEDDPTDQEEYQVGHEFSEESEANNSEGKLDKESSPVPTRVRVKSKEVSKLTGSQSTGDLLNERANIKIQLKYSGTFNGTDADRQSFRDSIKIDPVPNVTVVTVPLETQQGNDSSDDEIKDYLVTKENYDEISHV